MSALDHLRLVARSWRLVLAVTLGITALGVAASLGGEDQYRAHTQVFVAATISADDADNVALANTYVQTRVPSYLPVATSPLVVNSAINRLDLDVSYDDLSSRITATATLGTVLIDLSVTDPDPEEAARVLDVVAERFAEVVADIERTPANRQSPVRLRVAGPALVPTEPDGTSPLVTVGVAFVLGLGLAVGLAVLRARLDHRVKDPEVLSTLLGAPVLTAVTKQRRGAKRPGSKSEAVDDPRADAWRLLRTNLTYLDVDDPPSIVAVTSALPGEGKTTTAIGLAMAMAEAGRRVCLVEADLRKPVLATALGLDEGPGLRAVLEGEIEVTAAVRSTDGVDVLPAGSVPSNPTTLLDGDRLREVFTELEVAYDDVVVDTAPLLAVSDGSQVAAQVPVTVLVVRAKQTTHEQVSAAVEVLDRVGVSPGGGVLTYAAASL